MRTLLKRIAVFLVLFALVASVASAQSGARGSTRTVRYTLRISSNAPNSRVFINAVAQSGTTPMELQLNAAEYTVVIRAPGYQDFTTKVNLNRDMTVTARMRTSTYTLTINANAPGARVTINGANKGNAPVSATLQAASYEVTVTASGYEAYSTTVSLNRNTSINATLQPVLYRVAVNANIKGATVFINGTPRGTTPAQINLQMGNYTVRVVADGYLEYNESINVQRNTSMNANLQPAFSWVVVSIPQNYLNSMVKDPISLFRIYIDGEALSDAEMRQLRFQIRPGRHTVWIVTGGLKLESSFVFNPARDYILNFGYNLQLMDETNER